MEFKEKLKKLRMENDLTQEALAAAVNVSRSAIAKYENGNGEPSLETMQAIADYFGIPLEELLEEPPKKKNRKKPLLALAIAGAAILLAAAITVPTVLLVSQHFAQPNVVSFSSEEQSNVAPSSEDQSNIVRFSSEEWKKENNYKQRYLMLDDFSNTYDIRGWSLDQLTNLLGQPNETQLISLETDPPQFGGYIYQYYLDSGLYYGVSESLTIEISATYHVSSCYYEASNGIIRPLY